MTDSDNGFRILDNIRTEFRDFLKTNGAASETDTRVKLIDRILKEVLGWSESAIKREPHVESGYIDYQLSLRSKQIICVEAKREAIGFTIPTTLQQHKSFALDGTLVTDIAVKNAVEQVRQYCDDAGIRYAVATNGSAWIIFRAVRDDMPWRKGRARVFPNLDYIREHFVEFWNLLSAPAVEAGSLDAEFGPALAVTRGMHRVINLLFNADLPLQRNRLHTQLLPLTKLIFEDIADQNELEVLQNCYVHNDSLRIVASDLNAVITDTIPKFLRAQGAKPADHGKVGFDIALSEAIRSGKGQLFLLLGGIGSGKTTFLKRYQRQTGADLLNRETLWFTLDFLEAPLETALLEDFVWSSVLREIRTRYASLNLETRTFIKDAFKDEIKVLEATALNGLKPGTHTYERRLQTFLLEWQQNESKYAPASLRTSSERLKRPIVLFIDNVDQLDPTLQAQVFLLAQRVTRSIGSLSIVAMREESYYTANVQHAFTAYTSRKFHIASPRFRVVIQNRINYAIRILTEDDVKTLQIRLGTVLILDRTDIANFLRIVQTSIFHKSQNIARFIEAICFGNTRLALQMFAMFLTSGATDVEKMLLIYQRDGTYYVAHHEFVKSIMLGERLYYKEEQSPIVNVFECTPEKNAGHFTAWRLLNLLLARRGQVTSEGQGYVSLTDIVSAFEDVFDNRSDLLLTVERLVRRQLIEANTRSTVSIKGASHVRVTSAGWYYLRYLVHSFAYLGLVLQDTPINDLDVARELRDSLKLVDNLGDREDNRLERLTVRFERVERFLKYLSVDEQRERQAFLISSQHPLFGQLIMDRIDQRFQVERAWIEKRVRENREKYADEIADEESYEDAKAVGIEIEDENQQS